MFLVRYVALAALVVWLAGLLPQAISDALRSPYLPLACGAVVLVSLLVLKFVGPPPRAFFVRAGVVVAMLIVAGLASNGRLSAAIAAVVNITFAAVLLLWYVYE
jgi:hypothetical protein